MGLGMETLNGNCLCSLSCSLLVNTSKETSKETINLLNQQFEMVQSVKTYVNHVKIYVNIELANPLTKLILLVIGQIQNVFNVLRNKISSLSVKIMQVYPRIK